MSAEKKEWLVALDRAVRALPPSQRTALVLAESEPLPYEQVAEPGGAGVRYSRKPGFPR